MVPSKSDLAKIVHQLLYGSHGPEYTNPRQFLLDEYVAMKDMKADTSKSGHLVYFVGSLVYGWVKIGYTKNIQTRMCDIQVGCPFPIELLHTISTTPENARKLEKSMHRQFKGYRLHGEWFKLSDEIRQYITESKDLGQQIKTPDIHS